MVARASRFRRLSRKLRPIPRLLQEPRLSRPFLTVLVIERRMLECMYRSYLPRRNAADQRRKASRSRVGPSLVTRTWWCRRRRRPNPTLVSNRPRFTPPPKEVAISRWRRNCPPSIHRCRRQISGSTPTQCCLDRGEITSAEMRILLGLLRSFKRRFGLLFLCTCTGSQGRSVNHHQPTSPTIHPFFYRMLAIPVRPGGAT